MKTWEELAQKAIEERGYLVCASPRLLRVGEIIADMQPIRGRGLTPQPFRVLAVTDWEDFNMQAEVVGAECDSNPYAEDTTFYRVGTD